MFWKNQETRQKSKRNSLNSMLHLQKEWWFNEIRPVWYRLNILQLKQLKRKGNLVPSILHDGTVKARHNLFEETEKHGVYKVLSLLRKHVTMPFLFNSRQTREYVYITWKMVPRHVCLVEWLSILIEVSERYRVLGSQAHDSTWYGKDSALYNSEARSFWNWFWIFSWWFNKINQVK